MLNIFVYFYLMFYMFIIIFLFSLCAYFMDLGYMFEWLILSINSVNIEMMVLIDWVSLLFVSFIFLISSMIILYSFMYMEGEKYIYRFIYLVILFIFSMILMILSPNLISILFGWDGLGLVSYCLVIFYQNYMSYNSGMVTVLCNRVGDVGLLMGISLMMMKGGWSLSEMGGSMKLVVFMLFLAAITKSAQIPFSTWLPMAMAAPTPVSALVHSSTLVTAGVYLMIRFNKFLLDNGVAIYLFFLSVLTMFMSGLMANVENDLKKIIALSTLSQLGLMMMILSVGMKMVAFYHLLTHAIFKSMLFMCAGIIIHLMMNNQDIRLFGNMNEVIPFTMMSFFISSAALCGLPFLAGFYSKDLIMELVYSFHVNIFILGMIVVSLAFTVSYSFRLYYYIFFSSMKFYSYFNYKESKLMNFSMMILVLMSVIAGSLLGWMFFINSYSVFLSFWNKILTLMMCFLGIGLGISLSTYNFMSKFYYISYYLGSMWYLSYLYLWMYAPINLLGVEEYEVDKSWVEYFGKGLVTYLYNFVGLATNYKMYMFMCTYVIFMMIYILIK